MQTLISKNVSFIEAANKQGHSAYDFEESRSSWLRKAELKKLSYEAQRSSLDIQIKQPINSPKCYASVLTRVYMSCMDGKLPSKQAFQLYVQWNEIFPERRGIERYCVRNMASAIKDRVSESNILVLALQTQLVLEGVPLSQRSEKIGEVYKKQVQPARVLARIQGIADATTNKEEISIPVAAKSNAKRPIASITKHQPDCLSMESATLPLKKRKFFNECFPLAPAPLWSSTSSTPPCVPPQLQV